MWYFDPLIPVQLRKKKKKGKQKQTKKRLQSFTLLDLKPYRIPSVHAFEIHLKL